MGKYDGWAGRHLSRGGRSPADPAERAQPPVQVAAATLPPPPPGYAYVLYAGQPMLVPLQGAPPPPAPAAAPVPVQPRQPGQGVVVSYVPQPMYQPVSAPGQPPAISMPAKTNVLVKPGNRDTYAELLATIPDLTPNVVTDTNGPAPATMQELNGLPEFNAAMLSDQNAYPRGAPTGRVAELGSAALPDLPAEPPAVATPPPPRFVPAPVVPLEEPGVPAVTRPTTNGRHN